MNDILFDTELRSLIPSLSQEERQLLEVSLVKEGNRIPITIWKETGLLLDGHNRYDICSARGIPLKPPEELSLVDRNAAIEWILLNQLGRRNLSPYSRSVLALKLEEVIARQAKERQEATRLVSRGVQAKDKVMVVQNSAPPYDGSKTRDAVAALARVSHDTIAKVKVIEEKGTAEQRAKLVAGTATVNRVFNQLKGASATVVIPPATNHNNVTVLVGDMTEVIPGLGKFDLIIADPPYNVTDHEWDNIPNYMQTVEQWLTTCKAALSEHHHFFWFCSPRYIADTELVFRKLELPILSRIIWHRRNMAMGSLASNKFIDSWEMIFHTGNTRLNIPDKWDGSRFDVQTFAVPQTNFTDQKIHPTQKPLGLIEWLVRYGSFLNSRVLDPFAGGGTTGIAAQGLECVLIEKREEYANIARQRLGIK